MDHPTPGTLARQVVSTRRELITQPGLPFADHLPEGQVRHALAALGHSFRDRMYTPAVTPWIFLSQVLDADHSCEQAVDRYNARRVARGLGPCSGDTGAYCKARARLPEDLLHELARQAGRGLMNQAQGQWLWKGRHVKVVDGTGLSMPDTPENQAEYPQPEQIPAGVGFPLLRLVVVFSLAVGAVLDAAMGPFRGKGTGEVSLFRTPGDVLDPGDVLLADRIYSTFWDVARARARGADVVMRPHAGRRQVNFRGRGHGTGNRRVWWTRPQRPSWMTEEEYETYPKEMRLRAVRVGVRQKGFRTKRYVLITTLTGAAAYPAKDLAGLYRRRWQAELDLRSLKTTLQMDILRGKSPGVVRKEVWAHLLVYNMVRTLMARAAADVGVRPDELSFTGALHAVNAFLPELRGAPTEAEASRLWPALLATIGRRRVGGRPDRYEPRKIKRRPKNYGRLKEPRKQARARMAARA